MFWERAVELRGHHVGPVLAIEGEFERMCSGTIGNIGLNRKVNLVTGPDFICNNCAHNAKAANYNKFLTECDPNSPELNAEDVRRINQITNAAAFWGFDLSHAIKLKDIRAILEASW